MIWQPILVGLTTSAALILIDRWFSPWVTVHDSKIGTHHWTQAGAERAAERMNRAIEKRLVRLGFNAVLVTLVVADKPIRAVRRRDVDAH